MTLHSINRKQRLYVLPSGGGYSCLGFEVTERRRRALWAWVGQPCRVLPLGHASHYADYQAALAAGSAESAERKRKGRADWRCPAELTPALIGLEGKRVEVTGPDGYRKRFNVGRSTGWMPIHLEIANSRSLGGGAAYVPQGGQVRVIR